MGDADFVPEAIESLGGEIAFHRLPIRPGKPVLGASLDGKLILGLPGNPVSVAVTSRTIGQPLLAHLAGSTHELPSLLVTLANPDDNQLPLVWHRLVRINSGGQAELVDGKGSGDIVSLARSDGFVVVPPERFGPGPWPFVAW